MKKLILLFVVMLSGCAAIQKAGYEYKPEVAQNKLEKEFDALPAPDGKRVTVAVYSFQDKTGQRKPTPGIANLSTAVTQGGEVFLIRALQDVGRGEWFDVVERVSVDNLTKERTIIRQMREAYEGKDAKPLMPLQFAGLIMEGGIIGYDSGSESGGAAHRFLGIGSQTQYSKDTVTVSLRAVSVNTGKVLVAVTITKVVYSTADSVAVLKFLKNGTEAFEAEAGLTINEPGTLAIKATIEAAVVEMIKEGERKGVWDYKKPKPIVYIVPKGEPENKEIPVVTPIIKTEEPVVIEETKPIRETSREENKVAISTGIKPNTSLEGINAPALFGKRRLKETSYLHAQPALESTKKWQFVKGTIVDVRQPGPEGWWRVTDDQLRGGWIKVEILEQVN
jgi:curli production assembly/transport component CsgG